MDLKDADWRKSKRSGENGGNCVEITFIERRGDEPSRRHLAQVATQWRERR